MSRKLLFKRPPFSIWREPGVSSQAVEFLKHVVIGSAGVLYEHKNTARIIPHLQGPSLLYVTENEQILAMVVFCRNQITTAGRRFSSEYVRYLAAGPQIRGRGLVKKISAKVMDVVREGEMEKAIYFGMIEKNNMASYKVTSSVGYRPVGSVKTVGFSRFFPRGSRRIERLETPAEKDAMLDLLRNFYRDYALVHFDYLFIDEGYFVIREGEEIVAGAQIHLGNWAVRRMPGLLGKILLNVVPYIPVLNGIFNPRNFKFASFEGIYYRAGYEDRLFELFEGLLARFQLKSTLFWLDEQSPLYHMISQRGHLGLLNNFVKDADMVVMASFRNMTPEEEKLFEEHPIYTPSLDYL